MQGVARVVGQIESSRLPDCMVGKGGRKSECLGSGICQKNPLKEVDLILLM